MFWFFSVYKIKKYKWYLSKLNFHIGPGIIFDIFYRQTNGEGINFSYSSLQRVGGWRRLDSDWHLVSFCFFHQNDESNVMLQAPSLLIMHMMSYNEVLFHRLICLTQTCASRMPLSVCTFTLDFKHEKKNQKIISQIMCSMNFRSHRIFFLKKGGCFYTICSGRTMQLWLTF